MENLIPNFPNLTWLDGMGYPSLPEPNWNELDLILPVSRETKLALIEFVDHVYKWQAKTNLVANSSLKDIWTRHIADSLQVLTVADQNNHSVESMHGNWPVNWLDLGSGGGFPGVVLAIVLAHQSAFKDKTSLTMVESIAKKCAFLRQANHKCNGCGRVLNKRIEDISADVDIPEVITARALAPLKQLFEWSFPLTGPKTRMIFHKGREYVRELEDCNGIWKFDLIKHESITETGAALLEITDLEQIY